MLARRLFMTACAAVALATAFALPAAAQAIKIRMVGPVATNPQDIAHVKRIEDAVSAKLGKDIDIELIDLAGNNYAELLTLRLMSGDIPDLIYFQGGDDKIAAQGILEDLRPWIAKSEYLKTALWPHNVSRLENYPYLLHVFPARMGIPVVRKDWVEKAGVSAPQTLDEWTNLMRTIATSDFDGDGQNNSWGVTIAGNPLNLDELDFVFNMAFGIDATWMKNEAGEWINSRVSSGERDKLAYYNSLFAEKILDNDYVTTQWDVREDKFYTGRTGIVFGTAGIVVDIFQAKLRQVAPDAELVVLDPPEGVGKGLKAIDVSRETRGYSMSALSEHKEEAFAILDFLASPDGQMMDRLGFEGEEYVIQDGKVVTTEKLGMWEPRFMAVPSSAWTPPAPLLSPQGQESLDVAAENFRPDNAFVFPPEFAADIDAAETVYRTWSYRFVSGEASLDQWDQFVSEWNAAGGQRLTDYARSVLNG